MNSKDIKISIVVPIYNVDLYVDKCISSIVDQLYDNIEIILVDDGSTDKSGEICDHWRLKDNRITVIHKKNGGPVSARKAGTKLATGNYLISVDGDDWIEKDWVLQLADAIERSGADIIYRDGVLRDNNGTLFDTAMHIEERMYQGTEIQDEFARNLLQFNPGIEKKIKLNSVSWAYRTDLIKEQIQRVRNEFIANEDLILATYCIFNSNTIFVTKGGGYHYVQRVSSMSFSEVNIDTMCVLYNDLLEFFDEKHVSEYVKRIYNGLLSVNMLYINYGALMKRVPDLLPFFPKVKKNSQIVIFGAGRVGRHMTSALEASANYHVVALVDSFPEKYKDIEIHHVKDINKYAYDFIIVASTISQHIESMKKKLLEMQIPEQKIATLQYQNINIITK